MVASLGGVFLIVGILASACQADFGLGVNVPNLRTSVTQAIGSGVEPLLRAKSTISVDTHLDESGSLDAVVTIVNGVSDSANKVFSVTQNAVTDNNTPSAALFGRMSDSLKQALNDLEGTVDAVKVIKNRVAHQSICSNLTTIRSQEQELDKVLATIAKKVEEAQASPTTVTVETVGNYVTPAMVNSLTKRLTTVKSSVDKLANVLTSVVHKKLETVAQVSSVNATANEAQKDVASTLKTFNTNTETSSKTVAQTMDTWTSTVVASFSQMVGSPDKYHKEDIASLSSYLDTLNKASANFVTSAKTSFKSVQTKVLDLLQSQTKLSTDALHTTTKDVVYADFSSAEGKCVSQCPERFIHKLKKPDVQVGRLASCLSTETNTLLGFHTVLAPLLQQLQNNAMAVNEQQVGTCGRRDGPCSSVWFSAFDTLGPQVAEQMRNVQEVLDKELQFLQDRVDTCVRATTSDISDNLKTLLTHYNECLNKTD